MKSEKKERFFQCKNCDLEFNEENALLHDYTCPECGEILEMRSPIETIKHIVEEIKRIEITLKQIEVELEIIGKKKEKAKNRRIALGRRERTC